MARQDLRQFYKNNEKKNVRKLAGRALGYSSLRILANETRIWGQENPNDIAIAIVAGLTLIGSAVIGGCKIYQYLSR